MAWFDNSQTISLDVSEHSVLIIAIVFVFVLYLVIKLVFKYNNMKMSYDNAQRASIAQAFQNPASK